MIAATIDDNLERIRGDLVGRGLTYGRLIEDLLDHVCCLVEEYMNQGEDFETSYSRVLDSIGEKRLSEIQHQTLLNLDKKFQRMKKFTYVFGLSSALVAILGALFKKMHWPGAGILMTVGIAMVVLVFLPLYFITSYREQAEKKNPAYAIVGYVTLAFLLLGALFKNMHWPGAGIAIEVGLGFLIIGFIPLYVVNAFQRGGKEKVTLPYIVMVLVGISTVILFTNVRMARFALDVYLDESLANEERVERVSERTADLLVLMRDSTQPDKLQLMEKIHDQARELQVMIRAMQDGMITFMEEPGRSIGEVIGLDNRAAGREAILEHGDGRAFDLAARKYRELLEELVKDPVIWSQIEDHLEFTGRVWLIEFESDDVANGPLIKNYYKLSDASKGIALSEYVAITTLMHP